VLIHGATHWSWLVCFRALRFHRRQLRNRKRSCRNEKLNHAWSFGFSRCCQGQINKGVLGIQFKPLPRTNLWSTHRCKELSLNFKKCGGGTYGMKWDWVLRSCCEQNFTFHRQLFQTLFFYFSSTPF